MSKEKQYIVEEDTLIKLLELWHRKECGDRDEFEYFWDIMAESDCEQYTSHRKFVEAVENMTFEKLAEMDLALYEEYKEKCGNECQFKFKPRPKKQPVDNH